MMAAARTETLRSLVTVLAAGILAVAANGGSTSDRPGHSSARAGHSSAHTGNASAINVLWIIVDNMRPSAGLYGSREALTPNLDAFGAMPGTTTFTRAYCQLSWCSPSRNSFLSGKLGTDSACASLMLRGRLRLGRLSGMHG